MQPYGRCSARGQRRPARVLPPRRTELGDDIALSGLMAAAQAIDGVDSVTINRLERQNEGPNGEIAAGLLEIGPLTVARADGDPAYPENGRVQFVMRGGRSAAIPAAAAATASRSRRPA